MKDKLTSEEFKQLWAKSGNIMVKGRPVLPDEVFENIPEKKNKRVMNAQKVYDGEGEKLADSKWEYRAMKMLEMAGVTFDAQQRFDLLPTTKSWKGHNTMRKRTWTPDFTFEDLKIVADAKGHITEMGKLKMQIFQYVYPDWKIWVLNKPTDVEKLIQYINERSKDENHY